MIFIDTYFRLMTAIMFFPAYIFPSYFCLSRKIYFIKIVGSASMFNSESIILFKLRFTKAAATFEPRAECNGFRL